MVENLYTEGMGSKQRDRPVAQRPLILDVLPPDIAPRLDILPTPLYKRLARKIAFCFRRRWLLLGLILVTVAGIGAVWRPYRATLSPLPKTISNQIGDFAPYYFSGKLPPGISMKPASVTYSDGVLFFQVDDRSGNPIVISEQALPAAFANRQLQGDKKISGVDGIAFISDADGRLIGNFITSRNPQALVSLNASDVVSAATAQIILQALRPTS